MAPVSSFPGSLSGSAGESNEADTLEGSLEVIL